MNAGPVRVHSRSLESYPGEPLGLLNQPYAGNPRGFQATHEAEELLREAVGWWDCGRDFRPTDRVLKNIGTGGPELDFRMFGSTPNGTNDPLYLEPADRGYIALPQGNTGLQLRVATPDGDLTSLSWTVRIDWYETGNVKYIATRGEGGLLLMALSYSALCRMVYTSSNGVSQNNGFSPPIPPFRGWMRVSFDTVGADGVFKLETAPDGDEEPSSWTTSGSVTFANGAGIKRTNNDSMLTIGNGNTFSTSAGLGGNLYRFIERVNGSVTVDIDCDTLKDGSIESFQATTGQMVSIYRGWTIDRHAAVMPAKRYGSRPFLLFGKDDQMYVENIAATNKAFPLMPQLNSVNMTPWTLISVFRQFPSVPGSQLQHMFCRGMGNYASTCANFYAADSFVALTRRSSVNPAVLSGSSASKVQGKIVAAGVTLALTSSGSMVRAFCDNVFGAPDTQSYMFYGDNNALRLGGADSAYSSMELHATAFFHRVLTDREIQVITDYYAKPVSPVAYPVQAPDTERKAYLASKLGVDASTPALEVMKDAVFAIDANAYDGLGQHVENLGWGGPLLNARSGVYANLDAADPKYLVPETVGYVYCPGTSGNTIVLPAVASTFSGDVDVTVRLAHDTWASNFTILNKGWPAGGFEINVSTAGAVSFSAYDGSGYRSHNTANKLPASVLVPGRPTWLRVVRDADDGAGNYTTSVYYGDAIGSMTLLETMTATGTGNNNLTSSLIFGYGNSGYFAGKVYRVIIKDVIGGAALIDIDYDAITSPAQTLLTATSGQLIQVSRSLSGRKTVAMPNTSVQVQDEANIYLPYVSNNFLNIPNESAFNLTGDIDLRVQVAMDTWAPNNGQRLIGKAGSYSIFLNSNATIVGQFWKGGIRQGTSGVINAVASPNTKMWIRATLDSDNGAGGYDITFYTSFDGTAWTQLGPATSTVTGAGAGDTNTEGIRIGAWSDGSGPMSGKVYRAQVYNGIAGTKVLDVDCSQATAGQSTFTAVTGQTVTINSTANSGLYVNAQKTGTGQKIWLFGADDYFECFGPLQQDLLNFGPGESYSVFLVARQLSYSASQHMMGKEDNATNGWRLANTSIAPSFYSAHWSAGASGGATLANRAPGKQYAYAHVVDRAAGLVTSRMNDLVGTNAIGSLGGTTAAFTPMRIGKSAQGSVYIDMEFRAAMVFRRALTSDEIATLIAFYGG